MLNGDGLRTVLWVAGCEHRCRGCHNPITWDIDGGIPFDEAAEQELFEKLSADYISGITFSGGDPLHKRNREEITRLARKVRETLPEKTIWLYTGYNWEDIQDLEIVPLLDVIVDGQYVEAVRNPKLHWKGSAQSARYRRTGNAATREARAFRLRRDYEENSEIRKGEPEAVRGGLRASGR